MELRGALPAALFVLAAGSASADRLLVLNKSGHEAVLVDPATLEVVGRLSTGKGPHEAAVSPDGRIAWVANYGAYRLFKEGEKPQFDRGNTLSVLDLANGSVADTIDLGEYRQPHGIWVSRDGARLWLTCERNQAVLELETATGKIGTVWTTGQEISHMLVPLPDESRLYVANIGSGSVTVIERASGVVRSIPTGAGAEGIDASPDGREVWVTNRGANTISVIETSSDTVVATLESGGEFPIRVKFTPDGKEAWVSCARSNSIRVFDARTREGVATVEVGAMPIGIQMAPDGRRAYVANTNDNRVTVIDVPARRVVRSFSPGDEPDGMAWVTLRKAAGAAPDAKR